VYVAAYNVKSEYLTFVIDIVNVDCDVTVGVVKQNTCTVAKQQATIRKITRNVFDVIRLCK
jgi:hypothetical protein